MPKRPRSWSASGSQSAKKRVRRGTARRMPARSYQNSMVPMASRGYRLNVIEKKVNDIDVGTINVHNGGVFSLLACPMLGTDFTARIGRKITLKSVYVRGMAQSQVGTTDAATNSSAQQLRMILFIDFQPNGAAPATTDLLRTAAPASQLQLNNRDRFKILSDKIFIVDPYMFSSTAGSTFATACNQAKNVKVYKKINQEVIFNSTNGGTIADITSGALYMFWIGTVASGANDSIFVGSTRVRYVDC